jgi:predicted metal-dependent hydrolase
MRVRFPRIDYSNVRPDWAPNREFAHDRNASSTIPTYVEPYLIKVMQRAKAILPASETRLHAEIDIFIAQESQHFRQHNAFNRKVREAGYSGLAPLEAKLRDDYVAFLDRHSLKFNLAYSEGFESLGPPAAAMWFDHSDAFLTGADPEAVALWKWHMAEEFEHRDVCHRLFHALYSQGPWNRLWNGWLFRCYGFVCALRHLGAYGKTVRAYLIETDRAGMTAGERAQSIANERAVDAHTRKYMLPQLLKVFSPFYDPARKIAPRGLDGFLQRFEKAGDASVPDLA